VTVGKYDINGDGRLDRIFLYAHLSHRRAGQGFIPASFTLEVLLTGGGRFTAQMERLRANVTITSGGDINHHRGAELVLSESRFRPHRFLLARERQLALVYSFNGRRLIRAGSFWWFGDASRKYGLTCHEQARATIVAHGFRRQGSHWRRVDTTYRWFGAALRPTAQTTSRQQAAPSQPLTTINCHF
jgi:hypothetical protein